MTNKAGGRILLAGFNLEQAEKGPVNNLIKNYADRIEQRFGFQEIMLRLKKSQHEKAFLHEVKGSLKVPEVNKEFKAKATEYNLFVAISEVFEKLMREVKHKQRTKRQIR